MEKTVVQFPVGLRLLSTDNLSESRAARARSSARWQGTDQRLDEKRQRRHKRHGARAGAVIGENYATHQWLETIEHFGSRNDIDQTRHIMCCNCLDRELCDWETPKTGCDTQINVTRFYEGKTAPMYRPEKDDPDDEEVTIPRLDAFNRAFKAMADASRADDQLCTAEGLLRAALGRVSDEGRAE